MIKQNFKKEISLTQKLVCNPSGDDEYSLDEWDKTTFKKYF
jgi:hypothetical protein